MTMFDRYFGARQSAGQDYAMPSHLTAKEFGKVNVRRSGREVQVQFTILMEPEGREAEGWQTGVQANLGWEIDLWGRVKRQAEAAQAQLDASSLDAAAARVALTADAKDAPRQTALPGGQANRAADQPDADDGESVDRHEDQLSAATRPATAFRG